MNIRDDYLVRPQLAAHYARQPVLKNELLALYSMLRRQTPFILASAGIFMLLAVIYALTATPMFRASTQLSLDPRALSPIETSEERQRRVDAPLTDSARVDTMAEAIRSPAVIEAVVRNLGLHNDEEFIGSPSLISRVIGLISGPGRTPTEQDRILATSEAVRRALSVDRSSGTYLVDVHFLSEDPEKAARIADGFGEAYLQNRLNSDLETVRAAAEWMKARVGELGAQAMLADTAVATFKAQQGIFLADGRLIAEKVLADVSAKLTEAMSETATRKARYDRIVEVNQSADLDVSVTEAATNDVIIDLRKKFNEATSRGNEFSGRFGENHVAVQRLRREAQGFAEGIRAELRRIEENYRIEYQVARDRENALREEQRQQNQRNITIGQSFVKLQELESTAQAARVAYQDMLKRYTDIVQRQSFPIVDARIVSRAVVPTRKHSPRTIQLALIGAFAGAFLGLAGGVVRDLLDKHIRTRRDASAATGLDCLGMVPIVAVKEPGPPRTFVATGRPDGSMPWDYVMRQPFSVAAEAIRSAKIAIDHFSQTPPKILGIVSSLPGEGKSTIASMLAHLICDTGARVLLIDADLRHPALSRRLAPGRQIGLADVVFGFSSFDEAVVRDPSGVIDFLPALTKQRVTQSHELLGSAAMKQFLQDAAASYDYVVVDLPPLLPIVDVKAVASHIHAFLFVIAWAKTPSDVVEAALANTPMVREKAAGCVLNLVRLDQIHRYGEYVKSYYSGNYHDA